MLFLDWCFCFILFIIIGFDAGFALIMVAKILSNRVQPPQISGIPGYFKTESDIAVIVNVKILYRYIGDFLVLKSIKVPSLLMIRVLSRPYWFSVSDHHMQVIHIPFLHHVITGADPHAEGILPLMEK